jgi:redox-sensitive bicupin YhaK (pirin superfamily)
VSQFHRFSLRYKKNAYLTKNKVLAVTRISGHLFPMQTKLDTRITKRPAEERGRVDHGWLQARFTFSFADYFDPAHMGFRSLRVMNNDTIQPGGGFGTHPHSDMEIFTYVIEGQLEHKDSMGNGAIIKPGNLQYMSAASGVTHSEFNPSNTDKTRLYQIWLHPNEAGGEPRYAEKQLADLAKPNDLTLLYSGDGRDGSTEIRQNAEISFGNLEAGETLSLSASESTPHAWVQVISGELSILGESLRNADGLAVEYASDGFEIEARADSQFFVFRLS